MRRAIAVTIAALVAILPRDAAADCVQDATVTRECRLHLVTGPVLAPARVLGLGGAYQGIAEGLSGFAVSAAAPAVRTAWSHDWFDYDVDVSISIPNAFRRLDDLEFDGIKDGFDYTGFLYGSLGINTQFGPWGFGVVGDFQRFDLTPDAKSGDDSYTALLTKTRVLVARQFLGGDLVIGGGLRHIGFSVTGTRGRDTRSLVNVSGFAPEIGFLLRPDESSYRLGATFRAAVTSNEPGAHDEPKVGTYVIPSFANLPWELDVGLAMQGGPRPLNVHWSNTHDDEDVFRADIARAREHRAQERALILTSLDPADRAARAKELERDEAAIRLKEDLEISYFQRRWSARRKAQYKSLPREFILFTLGLLVTGPTPNGISLESFFTQKVARAGAVATFSPRAGVETELIPNRFRPRIGTYVEPSRFTPTADWKAFRQHVTFGFDLMLFESRIFGLVEDGTMWRISTAVDITHNYWNYGISIGMWR